MKNEQTIHPIKSLKWGILGISVYKGCIISKLIGGYSILGQKCKTEQEVDEIITKAGEKLQKSITGDLKP